MPTLARLALTLVLAALVRAQDPVADAFAPAAWRTREVAVGVTWRQARPPHLFGGPQQVSVLAVDTRSDAARLRVTAPAQGLVRTSALAAAGSAVAAVNGGFFAKDGAPVDLLFVDGKARGPRDGGRAAALVVRDDGARLADTARVVEALHAKETPSPITGALAAGPWLVRDGTIVCAPDGPRHPRTAVGQADGSLVFVTVDGRTPPAFGMTLHELAQTMRALGCGEAFNLDGGGSTTMWVRSLGGVVNCPCDDKQFDAAGERAVGNAVLVLGRAIWTFDEEVATLSPAGAFAVQQQASCTDGDCAASSTGGEAVFDVSAATATDVALEVFTRKGDAIAWQAGARQGSFTAKRTGWYALDDLAWPDGAPRRLTLRSAQGFAVDAVRVTALAD